ncbi:hypothetical protein [Egbenema bharatensis]|uniref:hypothetical protein n=1 Tax=Egbenema bharatensis TaxID=3463334 RepID=UPI003A8ABFC2
MTEVQKSGQPNDRQPDEWQQDFNPNLTAVQNTGLHASQLEKEAPTAYDIKLLHDYLPEFNDEELKQIPVVPQGCRLKQGATYIDLMDRSRPELMAMGDMEASRDHYYVPKTEVNYELWNRLLA